MKGTSTEQHASVNLAVVMDKPSECFFTQSDIRLITINFLVHIVRDENWICLSSIVGCLFYSNIPLCDNTDTTSQGRHVGRLQKWYRLLHKTQVGTSQGTKGMLCSQSYSLRLFFWNMLVRLGGTWWKKKFAANCRCGSMQPPRTSTRLESLLAPWWHFPATTNVKTNSSGKFGPTHSVVSWGVHAHNVLQ